MMNFEVIFTYMYKVDLRVKRQEFDIVFDKIKHILMLKR